METIAYKMAYLVGVTEKVLKREYPDEYEASNQTGYFGNYLGAVELRALVSLRHSVLRYKHLYKTKNSIEEKTQGFYTQDIERLKNVGVDIERIYKENSLVGYINILTTLIDGLKEGVMQRLEIPRISVMKSYIYFPKFQSEEALQTFLNSRANSTKMHGILFYYGDKIEQSVAFALKRDKNALYSAYSMLGEYYDNGEEINQDYVWVGRKPKETIVEEIQEILQGEEMVKAKAVELAKKPQKVMKVKSKGLGEFLTEEVEVFVDCDNSDFFKVINFIKELEQQGKQSSIRRVKLIVDKKSNFLWKVFRTIYTGQIAIDIVQVSRIKDTKSVADIVLTKEICESYYTKGLKKAVVMSSDSDFYGVITSLPELEYCVCYVESQTHDGYLEYLEQAGIVTYNLAGVQTEEYIDRYKGMCIEYLLGYVMAMTPIAKWDEKMLIDNVEYHINREMDETIAREYIEQRVVELKKKVEVTHKDGVAYLKVGEIEINTTQL